MSVRKTQDQNIRKLTKVGGGTLAVTLPIAFVRGLKWREKQKVVVKKIRGGIIIRDWRSSPKVG